MDLSRFLRFGATVTILVSIALFGCSTQPESGSGTSSDTAAVVSAPVYQNLDPSVSYVGIDACAGCHSAKASTYVESQMGRSFRPATRSNSDADWDNTRAIYDPFVDFYYLPFAE
ncbi:MAG: hypothetical protein ACC655_11470, partial [Rhodothermia bacterium]